MKLLPTPPNAEKVRANSDDSLGHGMDAVIMLAIFLGLGWGLDIIFGTIPVFMITMTVIGSVGLFARFYYSYGRRMDRHDADRVAKLAGRPALGTAGSEDLA
jgi:F0F1-type ATP synthase assembly protein I